MRILIAIDAWHPQVNGVVRALTSLTRSASALGAQDDVREPTRRLCYSIKLTSVSETVAFVI